MTMDKIMKTRGILTLFTDYFFDFVCEVVGWGRV